MQALKNTDWSYLAAIFDGEGCFNISYYPTTSGPYKFMRTCLQVSITNTSRELMKYLVSHFGGVYYTVDPPKNNPTYKTKYSWRPKGNKNTEKVILGLLPYMVIKTEQAQVALEYIRINGIDPKKRYELHLRMIELNNSEESLETNTLDTEQSVMIESVLVSDNESALAVMSDA